MTEPGGAPAGPGDGASRLPGPPGAPEATGRGMTRRRALLTAGGLALAGGAAGALMTRLGPDGASPTTTITLVLRDADGAPMTLAQVRAIQSAGKGEDGYDDALLDSTTLEVIAIGPLYEEDGAILVDVPEGRDCALCLSWPTSQGYSALIADLPPHGSAEVLTLAARDLHQRQRAALAALADPSGAAGPTGRAASALEASRRAHAATQSAIDSGIGDEQGARLLELAAAAQVALDTALIGAAPPGALIGATLTEAPSPQQRGAVIAATGSARRGAVRLVLDDASAPALAAWREAADALQRAGIHVMGQICDSEGLAALSDSDFDKRLDAVLAALPGLDSWEVGNELGGDWLGEDPVGRATRAARAVKERTGALTVLTLYYQLGQAAAQGALFNVAASLAGGELMGLVDVVGISVYPQSHPLGTAADRVMSALADRFPGKRVAVTELGYGGGDLDEGPWWFGSREDADAARIALIAQVTGAALGRPQAWGAPFWWYFLDDEEASASGADDADGSGGGASGGGPGGLGPVGRSLKRASERASAPGS
ncbi:Tat pathway signal sequence [Actinomyces sp. zg328]|uniref:Tat pathway signal sequence n=1 Tax=Actinomyces sp. zg328 TaxID=2609287 RepID=UPI00135957BF|nr:Tat pathway signal sequence [Actinomyces sp. zg328]